MAGFKFNSKLYYFLATKPLWLSLFAVVFSAACFITIVVPIVALAVFSAWPETFETTYVLLQQNSLANLIWSLAILTWKDFDTIIYNSAQEQLSFLSHCGVLVQYFFNYAPSCGAMCFTIIVITLIGLQYFWNIAYALAMKHRRLELHMPWHRTANGFVMVAFIFAIVTWGGGSVFWKGVIIGVFLSIITIMNYFWFKTKPLQTTTYLNDLSRIMFWVCVILLVAYYVYPNCYADLLSFYFNTTKIIMPLFSNLWGTMQWLRHFTPRFNIDIINSMWGWSTSKTKEPQPKAEEEPLSPRSWCDKNFRDSVFAADTTEKKAAAAEAH